MARRYSRVVAAGALCRDERGEQGRHGGAFVGEDPDIAASAAESEGRGQRAGGPVLIAAGRPRQGQQGASFYDAADPVLAGCRGVEALQEGHGWAGEALREQHPCQYQVARFAPVGRLVVDAEVLLACPSQRRLEVTLG